jgi:hypothetical protein
LTKIFLSARILADKKTNKQGEKKMLKTHEDLQIGKEKYLGPSHGQFANRYLRRSDGVVEVQRIVRYGKNGETVEYTLSEFDKWLELCRNTRD